MGTLTSYVGALDAAKSAENGSAGFSWININTYIRLRIIRLRIILAESSAPRQPRRHPARVQPALRVDPHEVGRDGLVY